MTSHNPNPTAPPGTVARALVAVSALVALVVGVPLLLVALGGALPVDLGSLAPAAWGSADDGRLLLLAILGIAWAAWGGTVLSVAVEAVSAIRRVPTPSIPGLGMPQRMAASLVAVIVVGLSPGVGSAAPATAADGPPGASATAGSPWRAGSRQPAGEHASGAAHASDSELRGQGPSVRPAVARAAAAGPAEGSLAAAVTIATSHSTDVRATAIRETVAQDRGSGRAASSRSSDQSDLPAVTSKRHDTLWMLAEQHLGSGERYVEIEALNRGVPQADGRALGAEGRVYPGWRLLLPADANVDVERPERHRVVRGDTLWDIADDELGDPSRYPEIAEANLGDLQPDGRRLAEPDLILPGWILEIPASGGGSADPAPAGDRVGAGAAGADSSADADAEEEGRLLSPPIDRASAAPDADSDRLPLIDRGIAEPSASTPGPADLAAGDPSPLMPTATSGVAVDLPAGGTVAMLLLTGVGVELLRRRRQFQRLRGPGERMAPLVPGAQEIERASREALHDPGSELLDRALAQLAGEAASGSHELPDVRMVRAGSESVTLDLAAPGGPAIAPFRAADSTRWELDEHLLQDAHPEVPRALPGLITLGVSGQEAVLLNLESVGTLAVSGAPDDVADVLRGLAVELAFGQASMCTERTLCVADPAIADAAEAGAIGVDADPARASAALEAAARSGAPLVGDPLLITLSDRPLAVQVSPRSGCALITDAAVVGAGATLAVQGPGAALLLPERTPLVPQSVSGRATADLVGMLTGTDLPDPQGHDQRALRPSAPEPEVIDLREMPTVPPRPAPQSSGAPRVLVLGEVIVDEAHGKAESTRIGRLAETVAFILLNPGARPSELQGALWPGRRSNPQTCRQMISRARTWLGRADAGEPYLMMLAESEGRLRLREEVTSDWVDFQRLAEVGLSDPDDTEHLAAALALVRGRPFGSLASRELPWADFHINEMICQITDVAHELALRHERAGRRAAARDAALRGLRTECESELLEAIVARTGG